jgi:RNA polymerase sigma factor (sigma-70 family)
MTPDDAAFPDLIRRAAAGDAAARHELFARYHRAVRLAVRRRMPDRLRARFDSLDFAQDVWASFLALPADRLTFPGPDALVAFLAQVGRAKVIDAGRRPAADPINAPPGGDPAGDLDGLPAGGQAQTPSQHAIAAERWHVLATRLPPGQRAILERLRDGRSHAEIAADLNLSVRTVERIVRRLKDFCAKDA